MNRLCAAAFAAILLVASASTEGQGMGPAPGKHRFLSENSIANIPIQPDLDHVVFTAALNDETEVKLILDTGMPMPGLVLVGREKINRAGLNIIAQMPLSHGPGDEQPVMASIAGGVKLTLPGLELTDLTAIVEPEEGSLGSILVDVDGIIGLELFSKFAVTIDHDKHQLILVEPDQFQVPSGAETLPLDLKSGLPFLECSAEMLDGATVPLELVVDVGASHAISLNVGTHEAIVPPDNSIEALLGKTVSGEIYGKVGRLTSLNLGDQVLKNVVASFQTGPRHGPSTVENHGNLGHGVLRRFNVTFDYANQRMVLIPNSHFIEPFEFNMSGVIYSFGADETLKVLRIVPGSPAETAGLSAGDVISRVNGKPVGDYRIDELRILLTIEGNEVTFEAASPDGTNKSVKLTLRRII